MSIPQRAELERIARKAMITYGLEPDWPAQVNVELAHLAARSGEAALDLRQLPWSSIDNPDSRDLDQVEVSVEENGVVRLLIGLADVERLVARDSAIDMHALRNTTSVYTPARIFSMLPERLSTDLTSLNPDEDRVAIVVDLTIDATGVVTASRVYQARVRNHAQLNYPAVSAWLDGRGSLPVTSLGPELERQLKTQHRLAELLRAHSHEEGALEFSRTEIKPTLEGDSVRDLETEASNTARDLIEAFMVAANGATARFLSDGGYASIRRVVRTPGRWDRIVQLATEHGGHLPAEPDSLALAAFLKQQRATAPDTFDDLSLSVIKLLGGGEYVADGPSGDNDTHFALAVSNYTHSTAPNRRYPDLVTQRIVKAAIASAPAPYSLDELTTLAKHCTTQEDNATKVERLVRKAAAAMWLAPRIGEEFDAVVTGAGPKGTWVRLCRPPIEGKLQRGAAGLDVGDRLRVKLISVEPERGFIDFAFLGRRSPTAASRC